eukprot:scaffold23803_cov132-Cylindrotheca_fusiformis.AAC.2
MMTEKELARLIEEAILKPFRKTGSYGIVDRIVDNLTIEIRKVNISFQSMGKFKTKRTGPWTPPKLLIECTNLRIVSVDLHGHEGSPNQIWAHNHRRKQAFLLCRKVSMEASVGIISSTNPDNAVSIMKKTKLEFQVAIRQRLRDGQILAVQSDMTIPSVDLTIEQEHLPLLASLLAGIQYCVSKDRSFEDPLKPASTSGSLEKNDPPLSEQQTASPFARTLMTADSAVSWKSDEEGGIAGNETGADETALADNLSDASLSSSEDVEEDVENDATGAAQSGQTISTGSRQSEVFLEDKPVLVLPLGLVILENVCITASVHQVSITGIYNRLENGHMRLSARGSIAELIWPKSPTEFGFYVQSSVAYCSIEEKHQGQVKTILINGMAREDHSSLDKPSKKPQEVNVDENFPLFERRSIRDDPLDMRHSFPSQGLGQKATVHYLNSDTTKPKYLHEVGVDQVELVLDVESWWRVAKFMLNESGGGYDSRIHSGDWSEILTMEMLQNPMSLNIQDHLQDLPQLFLDENFMISSDMFNATLRFTNIGMRIPAAIRESIRACTLAVEVTEATVTVTSALPRTFLNGKVGNVGENGNIDFPNDPSDIPYLVSKEEEDMAISKKGSTFRQQLTVRGFQVRIIPVIPFCNAPDPQRLIAPTDCTMIASFESEPPPLGSKRASVVLFVSVQVHKVQMNVDFDLLAGMTGTLLSHSDTISSIQDYFVVKFPQNENHKSGEESQKIKKTFQGRQVMIQRHVSDSLETGGLAIVFSLQQSEFGIALWRQNLPVKSPLLSMASDGVDSLPSTHIKEMKLVDISMGDFEMGFEFGSRDEEIKRSVLKCCLGKFAIRVCSWLNAASTFQSTNEVSSVQIDECMVDVLTFGIQSLPGDLNSPPEEDQRFELRVEEQAKGSRAWSLAADITSPTILNLHVEELKNCFTLFIEAMLLPTWSQREVPKHEGIPFPDNTIGAFFYSLAASRLNDSKIENIEIEFTTADESADPLVERITKQVLKAVLPPNVNLILFRMEVVNLLIQLPFDNESKTSMGILLNKSDLCVRFSPTSCTGSSDIEDTLAYKGVAWSDLIKTASDGIYLSLASHSSLISTTRLGTGHTEVKQLIQPCGMNIVYSSASLDIGMSENLHVSDIRLIEAVAKGVQRVRERCEHHGSEIIALLSSRKIDKSTKLLNANDAVSTQVRPEADQNEASSRQSVPRSSIELLHKEILGYEANVRMSLQAKESELDNLKRQIFSKERERFSAVALVASRVAGWIRMGGLHTTGQRVSRKTTMWPHWAILRKDLLLLYKAPGEPRPIDVVLLPGARIRELGGRSSIKRGFAIIEISGTTRYFVTANGPDFVYWTNEISKALIACNGSLDLGDIEVATDLSQDFDYGEFEDSCLDDGGVGDSEGGAGLRERIRLGNRLNGAKNKLGSAIQTARKKGKELSDRARTSSADFDGSSKGSLGSNDLFENVGTDDGRQDWVAAGDDRAEGNTANGKRRFGSRIGSALQNARQKVLETPEKKGSFAGLRNKIAARSPGSARKETNSIGKNLSERDEEVVSLELPESETWTCQACTFVNIVNSNKNLSEEQISCDMCGSEYSLVESAESTDILPDTLSSDNLSGSRHGALPSVSEAQDDATSSVGSNAEASRRGRFRGLGVGSIKAEGGMRQAGRFNFRKRTNDMNERSSAGGDAVTMRDISFSKHAPEFGPQEDTWEPLKSFEGIWLVRVSPCANSRGPYSRGQGELELSQSAYENPEEILPDKRAVDSESMLDSNDKDSSTGDILFRIQVSQVDRAFTESSTEKFCRLGDMFELYAHVSESIERVAGQLFHENYASSKIGDSLSEDKASVVDKVIVGGMMLGGLLDVEEGSEVLTKTQAYQGKDVLLFLEKNWRSCSLDVLAEVIEAFLNSLLACPMPIQTLAMLSEFLGICASTTSTAANTHSPAVGKSHREGNEKGPIETSNEEGHDRSLPMEDLSPTKETSSHSPHRLFGLLTAFETELFRADNRVPSSKAESVPVALTSEPLRASKVIYPKLDTPLLPASVQEELNKSLHDALISVMAERDEANAQLVGTNVLHVHEVETEKRKNKLLAFELEVAKQGLLSSQPPNGLNLFGQRFDVGKTVDKPQKDLEAKLKQFQRENNDDMMMALSQQLAIEIHSKTEIEAEINRIKESEKVKLTTESKENLALKEELKRMRDLLAAEEQKKEDAIEDAERWKSAYERLKAQKQ